jgi:hypothetical protein
VTVRQQHLEETALALSASDHARSFGDIGACSVRNMIGTGKRSKTTRFVAQTSDRSLICNDLAGHFFTGK